MIIPTYIINLPTSSTRREYMNNLLSSYSFLDKRFIPAINGRQMPDEDRKAAFDYEASQKRYGRTLNEGEVGCALSHRLFYKSLLDSEAPFALVLEDDVSIIRDLGSLPWDDISKTLDVSRPRVMFLSGDYWRFSSKHITKVFDAVGTYAYLLNRAAAEKILSIEKPYAVADDWMLYKREGVKLFAVCPYAVDANLNMDLLSSDVQQDSWRPNYDMMSKLELIRRSFPAVVKRVMKRIGMFESKIKVLDNKTL